VQGNALRDRAKDIQAKGAQVLGASFDPVDANKKFAEKFGFPYPLLSVSKELGVQFGAADSKDQGTAKRVAYLIGADGKVKHVWPKAPTVGQANEILAQIETT
jgi:thioredoxin-dependent peroxiredoxin